MILFHHIRHLPLFCATRNLETGEPVLLQAGEKGYWPAPELDPDTYNRDMGVTPAQLAAMEIGSMFGWHVPGSFVEAHLHLNKKEKA
jgi:hypothetical protein